MSDFFSSINSTFNSPLRTSNSSSISKEGGIGNSLLKYSLQNDMFIKSQEVDSALASVPTPIKELADNCVTSAKYIQEHYDKAYGKGNWEYVSIGRSCSKIADCLEELGTKAYTIPISGLTNDIQNGAEIATKEGFNDFKSFIYSLGLNPEEVAKSNKTYVFQDFSDSGATMLKFEEFIKSPQMGLNKDNVVFESINSVIDKLEPPFEDFKKIFNFKTSLANQTSIASIKTYTNVKKLDVNHLKEITKGITDPSFVHSADFETALKHFINKTVKIL